MGMRSKVEAPSKPATISKFKTGKVVMFGSPAASGPISVFESKIAVELIDASVTVTFQATATLTPSAASEYTVAIELAKASLTSVFKSAKTLQIGR